MRSIERVRAVIRCFQCKQHGLCHIVKEGINKPGTDASSLERWQHGDFREFYRVRQPLFMPGVDQGISDRTGIPIGTVSIIVGAVVLLAWLPLRERPGLGTVLNVLLIGLTIDAALLLLETPEGMGARLGYLAIGAFLWGPGSGFYIGAGLGPGPRDGLMTGLSARGVGSIRLVRTGIELTALTAGWLLGGSVGLGTVVFAVTIGPNVQFFLPRLMVAVRPTSAPAVAVDPDVPPAAPTLDA